MFQINTLILGCIKLNPNETRDLISRFALTATVAKEMNLVHGMEELGETLANVMQYRLNFGQSTMDSLWRGMLMRFLSSSYENHFRQVLRIQEPCKIQWRVVIKQIPREVTVAAHVLARMMKVFPYDLIVFQEYPKAIVKHSRLDGRFMHVNIEIKL